MKQRTRAGIISGLTFLTLCLFILVWSCFSQTALNFLVKRATAICSDTFTVEEVTGSLYRGIAFSGLSFQLEEGAVEIERGYFRIRCRELLYGILYVEQLEIENGLFKRDSERIAVEHEFSVPVSDISLPVKVVIGRGSVTNVKLVRDNEITEVFSELQFRGAYRNSKLEILQGRLITAKFGVDISGELSTEKNWPLEIAGSWTFKTDEDVDFAGSLHIAGDIHSPRLDISFHEPFTGKIATQLLVSDVLSWYAEISLSAVDPDLVLLDCSGKLSLSAVVSGNYDTSQMDIALENGSGTVCGYAFSSKGAAHYDGETLGISSFDLESKAGRVHFHGSVGDMLDLQGTLVIPETAALYAGVQGSMDAKFHLTGSLAAPDIDIQANADDIEGFGITTREASLFLRGTLPPASDFQINLQAGNLMVQDYPVKDISLEYSGSLANHTLELLVDHEDVHGVLELAGGIEGEIWQGQLTDFTSAHITQGNLQLEKPVAVRIGRESSEVERFCLQHQSGNVCGDFSLEKQKWHAALELVTFDPVFFISSLSGNMNALVEVDGDLEDSSLAVTVTRAKGVLQGRSFGADGHVMLQNDMYYVGDSSLYFGDTSINLEGELGRKNNFSFLCEIKDIGLFFSSQAEGALVVKGDISGDIDHPAVYATLEADNLRYDQYSVTKLTGNGMIEDGLQGNFVTDFKGSGIKAGAVTVDSFTLKSEGLLENHSCSVDLKSSEGDFTLTALLEMREDWQIVVDDIQAVNTRVGTFALQDDTRIQKKDAHISMTPLCLEGEAFSFCLESSDMREGAVSLAGNIENLDLSLLQPDEKRYDLSGIVSGTFDLLYSKDYGPVLQGELSSPQIAMAGGYEDNPLEYQFSKVDLAFSYTDKKGEVSLVAQPEGDGKISAKAALFTEGKDFAAYPLEGEMQVQLTDLSFVELLSREELKASGLLTGEVRIKGSAGVPELHGDIALHEGALEFTSLGSRLEQVAADLDFKKNTTAFTVQGISGEGNLSGDGEFKVMEGKRWSLQADIAAENLNAVRTEEYDLVLDAQVAIACNERNGRVQGDIQARDGTIIIVSGAEVIHPSKDVVFIDDENSNRKKEYPLETSLWIHIDEDVRFDGYGLTSGLRGSLLYENMPGMLAVATGEITAVDGIFSLYATDLHIERGRLLFKGGALENPGLDIRAVRQVADKEVGVSVSGTLEDMEFELFSHPVMEKSDILAYLVVGKSMKSSGKDEKGIVGSLVSGLGIEEVDKFADDLDRLLLIDEMYLEGTTASGDMSLVVGKYLMKDLFIGYDHNFYDNLGEFILRYDLGNGFSVETQTSSESSGGDLMYTIER